MNIIEKKLFDLNIVLPVVTSSVANYVAYTIANNIVIISGQLPFNNGKLLYQGKIDHSLDIQQGYLAASQCMLNVISHLKLACEGNLNRVIQCLKITGYVNCNPDFTEHSFLINGASDLIVSIFDERGRHARSSVGVNSLPLDAPVEIEALFLIG